MLGHSAPQNPVLPNRVRFVALYYAILRMPDEAPRRGLVEVRHLDCTAPPRRMLIPNATMVRLRGFVRGRRGRGLEPDPPHITVLLRCLRFA